MTLMSRKDTKQEIENLRRSAKDTLLVMIYEESQIGRSISSYVGKSMAKEKSEKFKNLLIEEARNLRTMVDNKTITNQIIRSSILELSKNSSLPIGHAQKVLNVFLKYYCLMTGSPIEVISELDCPLDSTTMEYKEKIKNIDTMEKYTNWQDRFDELEIRLLNDLKYDEQRLREFTNHKNDKNNSFFD